MHAERYQQPLVHGGDDDAIPGRTASEVSVTRSESYGDESSSAGVEMSSTMGRDRRNVDDNAEQTNGVSTASIGRGTNNGSHENNDHIDATTAPSPQPRGPTAMIPFAIAKLY